SLIPRPPPSILFPYTTLFRSRRCHSRPAALSPLIRSGRIAVRAAVGVADGEPPCVRGCLDIGRPDRHLAVAAGDVEHIGGLAQRSEEHTSELQSRENLVCRLL